MAEGVGFEPTVPQSSTPDFESGPFDHSGTLPREAGIHSDRAPRCQGLNTRVPAAESPATDRA